MSNSNNNAQPYHDEPVNGVWQEGYLVKEGGAIKTWKRRWFVLGRDTLAYYTVAKGGELKGQVSLNIVEEVGPAKSYNKKRKNCFEMVTPDRTYHFAAESESVMNQWINNISRAHEALLGPASQTGGDTAAQSTGETGVQPNKVKLNDFDALVVIGRGTFGKVMQVRQKSTGKIYAMKVINKKTTLESDALACLKAEKSILMKLSSPFLVKLYFSFQTDDKFYFVMDYVNGGELFSHLQKERRFDVERARFYSAEIVLGLEYLHKQGVIYRDLKPENLLIRGDGNICMTDFGISKEGFVSDTTRTTTVCGTPEYLAPEVIERKGYGKEVDWWSFGTLLYELLTGLPPFYSKDVDQMYEKILHEKLDPPKKLGEVTIDLLERLLERDPARRLCDPDQIKAHPFFATIDWDKLARKELTPPYIPPVDNELSVDMIDPSFTEESVASPVKSGIDPEMAKQAHVEDFTYVAPSAIP